MLWWSTIMVIWSFTLSTTRLSKRPGALGETSPLEQGKHIKSYLAFMTPNPHPGISQPIPMLGRRNRYHNPGRSLLFVGALSIILRLDKVMKMDKSPRSVRTFDRSASGSLFPSLVHTPSPWRLVRGLGGRVATPARTASHCFPVP